MYCNNYIDIIIIAINQHIRAGQSEECMKEVFTVITTLKVTCSNKQVMFSWVGFQIKKVDTGTIFLYIDTLI